MKYYSMGSSDNLKVIGHYPQTKLKNEIEKSNGETKPFNTENEYGKHHEFNEDDCPE